MTDDVDWIMDVMAGAFDPHWGEAWNRRQITSALQLPTTLYRLIDADGRRPDGAGTAAGFTLTRAIAGEEELLLIAVRPEQRGNGLGRQLLAHLIKDATTRGAERIFLEMRSNNPAERLYRSLGFVPIGLRKDYYVLKDGSRLDAITFAKSL